MLVGDLAFAHLIRIMFKRTVVTHVSNTIEVCVSLVNIVHIGTVVLFIQYAWKTMDSTTYSKIYNLYYNPVIQDSR